MISLLLKYFFLVILSILYAEDNFTEESVSALVLEDGLKSLELSPLVSDIIEKFDYNPEGKRDPFEPYIRPKPVQISRELLGPLLPLQRYSIDQLELVGIIWGGDKPMAMLVDASKKVYYVRENDKIGNNSGYVAKIREGELVVIEMLIDENGKANYVTRVMKINPAAASN